MALLIRPADVHADRSRILQCLKRDLSADADDARYDWLYLANPSGPARVWEAVDPVRGETVGVASAFPRRSFVEGKDAVGWVLGDFCIREEYRALGPAVQLNRACLEAVDDGSAAFCYDFPSRSMMAVYKRLRITPIGDVVRFARVLRWGRRLRRAMPNALGAGLSAVASLADRRPARGRRPAGLTIVPQTVPCGEEFDALDQATRGRTRLHLDRSSAHLNWRYRARPGQPLEMLAARDDRALRGYVVTAIDGDEAHILDLSARDDEGARALLDEALGLLYDRGATTVSMSLFPTHPLAATLEREGFRPREGTPVILHGGPALRLVPALGDRDVPLTHGDRES